MSWPRHATGWRTPANVGNGRRPVPGLGAGYGAAEMILLPDQERDGDRSLRGVASAHPSGRPVTQAKESEGTRRRGLLLVSPRQPLTVRERKRSTTGRSPVPDPSLPIGAASQADDEPYHPHAEQRQRARLAPLPERWQERIPLVSRG